MSRAVRPARLWSERAALLVCLVVFLAPILWLVWIGYQPAREIFSFPPRISFDPTLANFETIFGLFDMPLIVWNSIVISAGSTLLSLLIGVVGVTARLFFAPSLPPRS